MTGLSSVYGIECSVPLKTTCKVMVLGQLSWKAKHNLAISEAPFVIQVNQALELPFTHRCRNVCLSPGRVSTAFLQQLPACVLGTRIVQPGDRAVRSPSRCSFAAVRQGHAILCKCRYVVITPPPKGIISRKVIEFRTKPAAPPAQQRRPR